MPQQQEERQKGNAKGLYLGASGVATCVTPFIHLGGGAEALGIPGVIAFLIIFALAAQNVAADTPQYGMGLYFAVWLFALVYQRVKTTKLLNAGEKIHSRYQGYPELARILKCKENTGKMLEVPMVILVGMMMEYVSEPVGGLLIGSGIALAVVRAMDYQRNYTMKQQMDDARIENEVMKEYMNGRDDY